MPVYTVEDDFGNTLKLEGDSPPSEQELEEIFAQRYPKQSATSEVRGPEEIGLGEGTLGMKWGSPEMEKWITDREREEQQRQAIGRGMEAGTELTGAIAQGLGMQPQVREIGLDERIAGRTMGMDPEKAALVREQEEIADAGVPLAWRLGASAHSGLAKGMQMPTTLVHSLYKLGRMTPGGAITERLRKEILGAEYPEKYNDEYFQKLAAWEKQMSDRDAMLGPSNFATQLSEGTARGFAELPTQLLGGLAGGPTTAGAVRASAITGGATSGLQRFSQEIGEGSGDLTALQRGALSGLVTGFTTKAFGSTGIESLFRKSGVKGVANKIKETLKQAGYEGAEEATDTLQSELADYVQKNPNKPIGDAVHDVLLAGGVGFILGGGVSGARMLGGDRDASEVSQAATVYGDVRPQAEGQPEVPVQEGGQGVQPQAEEGVLSEEDYLRMEREGMAMEGQSNVSEDEYLQMEREGMDESNALLAEAIRSQGATGMAESAEPGISSNPDSPFFNRIALWDPVRQKIVIDPVAWNAEMQATEPGKRKQLAQTILNEEVTHAGTSPEDAAAFASLSSWAERKLATRIYTQRWGGEIGGNKISDTHLGYEMIRRRIQRINKMTPTEMVNAAKKERWKLETYDRLEQIISQSRELLGTKASKEQLAAIDRTLRNLGKARAAAIEAGVGDDDDRPAAMARAGKVKALLERIESGGAFPNNRSALEAGVEAESVDDLEAMLAAKRGIESQLTEARSTKNLQKAFSLVGPNQFLREAIEAATNSGSQAVDRRVGDDVSLPLPKLDWRKNEEVRQWLEQNGKELGIQIEAPAAMTRAAEKRILALRKIREAEIAASEREEMEAPQVNDRIVELSAMSRERMLTDEEQEELRALRIKRDQMEGDAFGPAALRRADEFTDFKGDVDYGRYAKYITDEARRIWKEGSVKDAKRKLDHLLRRLNMEGQQAHDIVTMEYGGFGSEEDFEEWYDSQNGEVQDDYLQKAEAVSGIREAYKFVHKLWETVEDREGADSEQSFPAAMSRRGISERTARLAEQRRRLMEMQAKARGEELPEELRSKPRTLPGGGEAEPVAPEQREVPESMQSKPPTSKEIDAVAVKILQGPMEGEFVAKSPEAIEKEIARQSAIEEETGRKAGGKMGISTGRMSYDRPSFEKFKRAVGWETRIEPHQLRSAWEDAVWRHLLRANPEKLEEWRAALGLEKKYGKTKITAEVTPQQASEFQKELLGEEPTLQRQVLARHNVRSMESAQRYRNKVMGAIARKLIEESVEDRPSLGRSEVGIDDIDFSNAKAKFSPYEEFNSEEASNLDVITAVLRDQARASSNDPESATRRLLAVADKQGRIELLSSYNDAGTQRITDPAAGRMTSRPSRPLDKAFLRQYRPIGSFLLADPVKGFRQQFQNVAEFNDKLAQEAHDRSVVQDFPQGPVEDFKAEGTPGIEGEGGYLIGKHKAASGAGSSKPGSMESQSELAGPETNELMNSIWEEVGAFDSPDDVRLTMTGLVDRNQRGRLTNKERMAISALRKMFNITEQRLGDAAIRRLQKQHPDLTMPRIQAMADEEILDYIANVIYENSETTKNVGQFVAKTLEEFNPRPRQVTSSPQRTQGLQPEVRELETLRDVAPTTVRPEQLPPGVEPTPYQAPAGPRQGPIPMPAEPTPEEIQAQRVEESRRSKEYDLNQLWNELLTADERARGRRQELAMKIRSRLYRKSGVLLTEEQATEVAVNKAGTPAERANYFADKTERAFPQEGPAALRRGGITGGKTLGEIVSNALHDVGSGYDQWMVDRIGTYGGQEAKNLASVLNKIIDREKELYGGLTPLLDRARKLSGGVEPARASMFDLRQWASELPGRARSSINAFRAVNWLNQMKQITPNAAVANVVNAIEGRANVPPWAQNLVSAAQAANIEIGKLVQPVVKKFKASGLFQRNMTSFGYDIIRQGGGHLWDAWTNALAIANKLNKADVEKHFRGIKEVLDDPLTSGEVLEKINMDMARKFPKVVTHLKDNKMWQPVIHSDLFNYLENAARRATHVRAFRETFPKTKAGQARLEAMVDATKQEVGGEVINDLHDVIRAMHGHPTDDYNNKLINYTAMGPQQLGGQAMRFLNQTVNNVLGKTVLSGQMFVQPGEVAAGSTPVFFGYNNYLRALARYRQLYPQLELTGAVNRVMHDYTFNPTSPVRSSFKMAGNVISKVSMQNALNELQEGMAAATARVVAERIVSGNLDSWEKSMLPQTMKMMGFNDGEVQQLMQGRDQQLLGLFQRRAAAFLTGGNKSVAEGSSLGSNRLFNSIFRFQTYPMIKTNQARKVLTNWVDAERTGTGEQKWAARRLAGRFFFGNALQGALTVGLTALAYGGMSGLKIRKEEAKDEPIKFILESFLSSISGPAYLLWRGKSRKGLGGYGEAAARLAFPYTVMNDLNDMGMGHGQYKDRDWFQRIGLFLKNKTPATKAIGTGLAMVGLSRQNQRLDQAIQGLSRWRRDELGFSENRDYLEEDKNAEFRNSIKEAIDAMKVNDRDKFREKWMEAARTRDITKVGQSLKARKMLVAPDGTKLTREQMDALRERIGDDAFEALEYYDLMLDQAAEGVLLPPEN